MVNQDWKNFSATKLAFASLGAATIIPIAKPLKPLLAPLKKVVDAMGRFPGAKHFAGGIGTAVKSALGGKTDKLWNLLPFIIIAIDLFEDPEVFEFIFSAIESEDDFWVWVDVISSFVAEEGGLEEISSINNTFESSIVSNPIPFLVNSAHALTKRQRAVKAILSNVKRYSSKIPANQAKKVTRVWKSVLNNPGLKKIVLKSGAIVRYFVIIGGNKIRSFVQNSRHWRVNRWFVLFAVTYLLEEYGEKRLVVGDERKLLSLIGKVFSNSKREYNGALFHLSQATFFHAMDQLGVGPKIKGIEQIRPAFQLLKGIRSGEPYRRHIDIILELPDEKEEWVEVKSYVKGSFSPSAFKNTPYKNGGKYPIYREFFHDMRLNVDFLTQNQLYRRAVLNQITANGKYSWYFHKWRNSSKGVPPASSEERKARDWLCAKPNINNIKSYYDYHFKSNPAISKTLCKTLSGSRINLRDTENYITDIIQRLVNEKGIDAQKFIDIVTSITDPDWQ